MPSDIAKLAGRHTKRSQSYRATCISLCRVRLYIYTHTQKYMRIYLYIYRHIYIHTSVSTHVHVYIHACIYMHTLVNQWVCITPFDFDLEN